MRAIRSRLVAFSLVSPSMRNPDNPDAEEQFKECSEAYAVLADTEKRARYDRFGHAGVAGSGPGGGFDPSVFLTSRTFSATCSALATCSAEAGAAATLTRTARRRHARRHHAGIRGGGFRRHQAGEDPAPGRVRHSARAAAPLRARPPSTCTTCGGRGQVRYQQGFFAVARPCSTCGGSGKLIVDPCNKCRGQRRMRRDRTVTVKVPAGVEEGARILYSGEGEAGVYDGPPGDLYVVLHCKEHEFFEREGKDLHCVVPISFAQAALGTEIEVPTLEGEHKLKVPEGTQTGTNFKLRNKGVPVLNGHGRGDLYVEMKVQTPAKLSKAPARTAAGAGKRGSRGEQAGGAAACWAK